MERDRRLWIVILAAGVGAILLSACLGALAGGAVGYWAARNVVKSWVPPVAVPQSPETPALPEASPPALEGALVTEVVDGGPADLAGIQPNDRIVTVDGIRLDEENTLERLIRSHKPGDRVAIALWQEGRERTVRVRLGRHPEDSNVAYLGVFYETIPMKTEPPDTD